MRRRAKHEGVVGLPCLDVLQVRGCSRKKVLKDHLQMQDLLLRGYEERMMVWELECKNSTFTLFIHYIVFTLSSYVVINARVAGCCTGLALNFSGMIGSQKKLKDCNFIEDRIIIKFL
ncbi:hypothetical protein ACFX1T_012620 [Malus domestica]